MNARIAFTAQCAAWAAAVAWYVWYGSGRHPSGWVVFGAIIPLFLWTRQLHREVSDMLSREINE